jgi:hypothetical protein
MKIILGFLVALILLASCRSSRKIVTVMTVKDTATVVTAPVESDSARLAHEAMTRVQSTRIDFNTFSAKIKVDYRDSKDRKYDFNAFVRIRKDSIMWVSVIATLGIEAFRVRITPDSVIILDKVNKTVQYKAASYLREITQLPGDFQTLQDLIIGNPVFTDAELVAYQDDGGQINMSMIGPFFKHFMTMEKINFDLLLSKLDDTDPARSRTASLEYDAYEPNGKWRFSNIRRVTLAEKTKIDVDLEFKQVEFDKPLSFPFSIPRNYKLK